MLVNEAELESQIICKYHACARTLKFNSPEWKKSEMKYFDQTFLHGKVNCSGTEPFVFFNLLF